MDLRTIGHYEIVSLLGEGGMGRVYLAHDTMLDRKVAIKVLSSPDPHEDEVARFEREARALAKLDHPNILSVHEFGRIGNMPYVVMELLHGKNLREMLKDGPIPHRAVLRYAVDVVRGLAAAHDKGIYHRDLKPENIFITADGRVKIVDFGLAHMRQRDSLIVSQATIAKLTAPGWVVGTLGYMAPEQVRGEVPDHRADIFALGAVLYEMLSGVQAFGADSMVASLHAVLEVEPPINKLEEARVPPMLMEVVTRCLQKDIRKRFQSATDVAVALENIRMQPEWGSTPRPYRVSSGMTRRTSVAVLPFKNIGADPEMEYFSDGVTEDIINALTQVEGVFVAARTSCFAFKGKNVAVEDIGATLRVQTVLEGSVRRAGNRLRITAQLIDAATGYQLWSERYDRELDDVFAIQDDIATNISQKLRVALSGPAEDEPLVKPATTSLEAYELYLKARYLVEQRGEGLVKGLEFFKAAIRADPEYALAYAGLAETMTLLAIYGVADPRRVLPEAKEAALKALALDDNVADAHNAMALISVVYDWNWGRAMEEFDRALQINPNYVSARYWRALFCHLLVEGRKEEAIREATRAVDLDPMATLPAYALGLVLIGAGRYAEAVAVAQRVLVRDPSQAIMYRVLGLGRHLMGQHADAAAALERGASLSMRHPWLIADLGIARAAMGDRAEAERLRDELRVRAQTSYMSPISLALIPIALGDIEEGVQHVQKAFETHDPLLMFVTAWPTLAPVRNDRRVREMFDQMGLVCLV